jgi:anaerobic selenocysteine-containing dehydrogenase
LEQLKEKPRGVFYNKVEDRGYVKDGFETPSGKVEIYSEIMAKHGYDPLPTFREPAETVVSRPDLADKYPLTLITGARTRFYTHSQHRNVPALREQIPEPLIEINTGTAEDLGIADGDMVKVESPRGNIALKARITDDIHPKVVSIQHGWSEANVNLLTDNEQRDPVSGYVGYKQVLCSVTKASSGK